MRASGLSAIVVLIALAVPALADEVEGVIEYTAAPECPDRDTFTRRVKERIPKNGVIVPETTARVTVEALDGEYLARVEVADPNAASSREVRGASCTEVSEAMALIVALALTGQMEPETAAVEPPVAAPPETAPPEPSKPAPAERDRQPNVVSPQPKDEPAPPTPSLHWLLGAAATATGGLAPNPAWGALLFVETGAMERATARVSAGARATFSAEQELGGVTSSGGPDTASTRFDWFGARVDGCLTPLSASPRAFLSACLALEGGWQRGHSRGIENPSDDGALWVAAALLARPRLALGSVVLEAEGGPLVPVLRDDFVIDTAGGDEPVHKSPDVSWTAAVGVAFRVR